MKSKTWANVPAWLVMHAHTFVTSLVMSTRPFHCDNLPKVNPGLLHVVQGFNSRLFMTDFANHCVWVYTPQGRLVAQWGTYGSGAGQLKSPSCAAVTRRGHLVVVDRGNHRVQEFRPDGTLVQMWDALKQFDLPCAVAITRDDEVIVTDNPVPNIGRVQVFDEQGTLLRKWSLVDSEFMAVCVTPLNQVVIANLPRHSILLFTAQGTLTHQVPFERPTGVAACGFKVFATSRYSMCVLRCFDLQHTHRCKTWEKLHWKNLATLDSQCVLVNGDAFISYF